jgi:hypothetical protein
MNQKITRRHLAAGVLGSSAVLRAAQTPEANQPEDPTTAAKEQLHKNAETLQKVELSMTTEPAFHFKA